MISEQAAGKMATFAKDNTDAHVPFFGWAISPETYQAVNPGAIVVLAPLVSCFFTWRAGRFPSTIMKFAISVFIIGLTAILVGYGFLTWTGGDDLAPWWFLGVAFVILTISELFLSPVGLSTTSALAPKSFASQAMALWLLTTATGQGIAGFVISRTAGVADSTYYFGLGAVTLVAAVLLFAVAPWVQRQMSDV
jgi:proton-dependent oligopeptide transporter